MERAHEVESRIVELAALRERAVRARQRRPWLSVFCDMLDDEIRLLESRGVSAATRLDLAADVGLMVLDMICGDESDTAALDAWPLGSGSDADAEEPAWRK